MKKLNWSMVLSHHPPEQYDRTYCLLGMRICVRCSAIWLTAISASVVMILTQFTMPLIVALVAIILLPLPGVYNFLKHEILPEQNTNIKRILTGILIGIEIGLILFGIWTGMVWVGLAGIVWLITLQLLVVLVMHRYGKLEPFMQLHEEEFYNSLKIRTKA